MTFLPRLRAVAAKAAQMIEDALYDDLACLMFHFYRAEGLVCKILALDEVYGQLRHMVAMGDFESNEILKDADRLLDKLVAKLVRVDPEGALGLELYCRGRRLA
jgi:hypothetical protein